jgi:hypothetical protein
MANIQHVGGDLKGPVPNTVPIHVGHDLDLRVGLQHLPKALDPVQGGGHDRLVDDRHLALGIEQLDQVLTGKPSAGDVVGRNVRHHLTAEGRDVGREHRDPCLVGGPHSRSDTAGVHRTDDHRIHPTGDEVLELGDLPAGVPLGRVDEQLVVVLLRTGSQAVLEVAVEHVGPGQQRDPDGLRSASGVCRAAPEAGADEENHYEHSSEQ